MEYSVDGLGFVSLALDFFQDQYIDIYLLRKYGMHLHVTCVGKDQKRVLRASKTRIIHHAAPIPGQELRSSEELSNQSPAPMVTSPIF